MCRVHIHMSACDERDEGHRYVSDMRQIAAMYCESVCRVEELLYIPQSTLHCIASTKPVRFHPLSSSLLEPRQKFRVRTAVQ